MALSKTPPKSALLMSIAITRFSFLSLSFSISIFKPEPLFFNSVLNLWSIWFPLKNSDFFLFFIFFKFVVLGFGCGNSESYKPRRVPTQRETSSKFVILFIHSFIDRSHSLCSLQFNLLFIFVEILFATSPIRPRADVAYCIHALSRRLAKTRNWTVSFDLSVYGFGLV